MCDARFDCTEDGCPDEECPRAEALGVLRCPTRVNVSVNEVLMKVDIVREDPKPVELPPVKEVVISLSRTEARHLRDRVKQNNNAQGTIYACTTCDTFLAALKEL